MTEAANADARTAEASTGRDDAISIDDLTVVAGERTLLESARARFEAGKIHLLVGASGAGKSVFLGILAGLIERGHSSIDVMGSVSIDGKDRFARGHDINVGIVFQSYALFDELSATGNVQFGLDHRRPATKGGGTSAGNSGGNTVPPAPHVLLDDLGVPRDVTPHLLSGGQKQRLAVARTLAFDPEILIYDEPTSGLDPVNAEKVARRIQETHRRHGKTTIIVTHDYKNLASIAESVVLLDHQDKQLRELDHTEFDEAGDHPRIAELIGTGAATPPDETAATGRTLGQRVLGHAGDFLAATCKVAEAALVCLLSLIPIWRSARWGLRYLWHYIVQLASPAAFAYFGAAGLIAGLVSTHFTFKFLPFKAYTEPLITEELLQGLGFALYRIVIPVLLTVLLAARGGAAIAADVGSRVYSRQIDALRSFGAPPRSYLLTNILYAYLLTTPFLLGSGFLVARFTSLVVFSYNYPQHDALFWDGHFHRALVQPGSMFYAGTGWTLVKVLACGLGIGAVSYFQGMRAKSSAVEVSRGITRTIIWGTLFVLLVHFAFAFIEF
jgi:ABC-type transporter Mla maintaining outer membrane lipid asymmetry ATPase subunit MlaF/ABC-type transporter Mla maintaining outer membrane lipid asymmetry permease subunit MlaE